LITDCRFINDKGREKNGPKAALINEFIRGKIREEKRREEKRGKRSE